MRRDRAQPFARPRISAELANVIDTYENFDTVTSGTVGPGINWY